MSLITNIGKSFAAEDFTKKQDPMRFFPDEIALKIFSYLDLTTLGKICRVNKEWKRLAGDPALWKIAIYREIAFGNDKWAACFGKEVVKDEEGKEEFSSLPWIDFIEDCKKFKSLFPKKKARERLMLVRLPKTLNGGLTLKSLGKLSRKYFSGSRRGYRLIRLGIAEGLGDKPIDKSRWVLMTKNVVPGSRNKSYAKQQKIVAGLAEKSLMDYEVPDTLSSAACILSQYFLDSKTRLFSDAPWTYTSCKEEIQGYQTAVGGFSPAGLSITGNSDIKLIGMAAMRKF